MTRPTDRQTLTGDWEESSGFWVFTVPPETMFLLAFYSHIQSSAVWESQSVRPPPPFTGFQRGLILRLAICSAQTQIKKLLCRPPLKAIECLIDYSAEVSERLSWICLTVSVLRMAERPRTSQVKMTSWGKTALSGKILFMLLPARKVSDSESVIKVMNIPWQVIKGVSRKYCLERNIQIGSVHFMLQWHPEWLKSKWHVVNSNIGSG